jgi:hypothetical protein
VSFTAAASGTAPLSYQWYKDGALLFGATTTSLTRTNVALADAGGYTLRVANSYGSATSSVATLTVLAPPVIVNQPMNTNVAIGSSLTLCVGVTNQGNGPFFYQWRRNGLNLTGATNACLTIPSVGLASGGTYTVVVRNAVDAVTSQPATVVILNSAALAPGDSFAARVLISGSAGTVRSSNTTATVEMGEPLHGNRPGGKSIWFRWTAPSNGIATFRTVGSAFDTLLGVYTGTNVTGLTSVAQDEDSGGFYTSLVEFNARAGTNYAIAVDGVGGASGAVLLNWSLIATTAVIPVILVQPVSQGVVLGSNAQFTVTAAGVGLTYQWRFNGTALPGATNATLLLTNVQSAQRGFYTVLVRNAAGNSVESAPAQLQLAPVQGVLFVDKLADLYPANTNQGGGGGFAPAISGNPNVFSVAAGVVYNPQVFTSLGRGTDPGEGNHCGVIGGASSWGQINVLNPGRLVIQSLDSAIDTVAALYTNSFCLMCDYTNVVACNDDAFPGVTYSRIELDVVANARFNVAVDGKDGATGDGLVAIALGSVPSATTVPVDMVERVGGRAQFGVTITGGSPAPMCHWFRDGQHAGMTADPSLLLEDLQPGSQGSYTVMVSNLIGTVTRDVGRLFVDEDLRMAAGSAFESGAEGWTGQGPTFVAMTHRLTGGNPGGWLEARVNGTSTTVPANAAYWRAPAAFLGNQASAYGGWLEYDLRLAALETLAGLPDVMLDSLGARLVFDAPANATTNWTLKRVPLTTNGWRVGSLAGQPPTCEQMVQVLGALTNLLIRAHYRVGLHTNSLDNVNLVEPFTAQTVRLEIRIDEAGQCYIDWPASATGWILESADDPACFDWTPHPTVPLFFNGMYSVPFNPTLLGPHTFFRLRKPSP